MYWSRGDGEGQIVSREGFEWLGMDRLSRSVERKSVSMAGGTPFSVLSESLCTDIACGRMVSVGQLPLK